MYSTYKNCLHENSQNSIKVFLKLPINFTFSFEIENSISFFSSVQNILFRYGIDLKLNFVLPKSGNHLNDPAHPYVILEPFKVEWLDSQIEKLPWHGQLKEKHNYDIFNLHTQWNSSAVR